MTSHNIFYSYCSTTQNLKQGQDLSGKEAMKTKRDDKFCVLKPCSKAI